MTTGVLPIRVDTPLGSTTDLSIAEQATPAIFLLKNQLAKHFLYYPLMNSNIMRVIRTNDPGSASFMLNNTNPTNKTFATLEDPPVTVEATCIGGDVDLTEYIQTYGSFTADQLQYQIDMKKIAIRIAFWTQFFRPQAGDSFAGLPDLVDPSQRIEPGPNGGPLSEDLLDDLIELVLEGHGEMINKCLVMTQATFKTYVRLVRGTGRPLTFCEIDGFRYATHNGVCIFIVDYIPSDETLGTGTNLTSVYCFTIGYDLKGLFGAVPPDTGDNGLVVYQAQYGANNDITIWRVKWYVTLILTQITALACLRGISN